MAPTMRTGACTLAILMVGICLQAAPASSFSVPLAKPPRSRIASSLSPTNIAFSRLQTRMVTGSASSRSALHGVGSRFSYVHNKRRMGWALSAKYDSLEEAMAYAKSQQNEGPKSENGIENTDGGGVDDAADDYDRSKLSIISKEAALPEVQPKRTTKKAVDETTAKNSSGEISAVGVTTICSPTTKPAAQKVTIKPAAQEAAIKSAAQEATTKSAAQKAPTKAAAQKATTKPARQDKSVIWDWSWGSKSKKSKPEFSGEPSGKNTASSKTKGKSEEPKATETWTSKVEDIKAVEDTVPVAEMESASPEKVPPKNAAATRAAKEKRAEAMAAKARGDIPKSGILPKQANIQPDKKPNASGKLAGVEETEDIKMVPKIELEKSKEHNSENTEEPAKEGKKVNAAVNAKAGKGDDAPGKEVGDTKDESSTKKASGIWDLFSSNPKEASTSITLAKPETIVVVTGATGRVGQLTVRRILELYPNVLVRAVVNNYSKGVKLLKEEISTYGIKLEITSAELTNMRSATKVVEGASAVIFCESGYARSLSPLQRLANALRLSINPRSVTDVEGVRAVALALKAAKKVVSASKTEKVEGVDTDLKPLVPNAPRFILLSSAAVTRPSWSEEEKALYPLAADVPIVKLNPLNILTVKADGEKELRQAGIPYTVVRPCGLNDDHPRGRPFFSVGDTAAGRISREDVADVLVRCLGTAEATGKTFEVQTLPGMDKMASLTKIKTGIDKSLANLPTDEEFAKNPGMMNNVRRYTYPITTQLRPVSLIPATTEEEW